MNRYIGINVGENKYFAVWYSKADKTLEKMFCDNCNSLELYIKPTKQDIVAIDAPPRPRSSGNRREAERVLGIGGYYATPDKIGKVKPWMLSGFDLWEKLENITRVIEVHPTIIFKRLENPKMILFPNRWIGMRSPKTKREKAGRIQRRDILKRILPGKAAAIEEIKKIDYLDALIAAYTAEQVSTGNVDYYGNKVDGKICFPK